MSLEEYPEAVTRKALAALLLMGVVPGVLGRVWGLCECGCACCTGTYAKCTGNRLWSEGVTDSERNVRQ